MSVLGLVVEWASRVVVQVHDGPVELVGAQLVVLPCLVHVILLDLGLRRNTAFAAYQTHSDWLVKVGLNHVLKCGRRNAQTRKESLVRADGAGPHGQPGC